MRPPDQDTTRSLSVSMLMVSVSVPLGRYAAPCTMAMACYALTVPAGSTGDSMDRVLLRCVEIMASVLVVTSMVHCITSLSTMEVDAHAASAHGTRCLCSCIDNM